MKNLMSYPIRATKIDISLNPFGMWLLPQWRYFGDLTESAKEQGETIWYIRWLWVQISYSRWV